MSDRLLDEAKLTEEEINIAVGVPDGEEVDRVADAALTKALRVFRRQARAMAVRDFYTGTAPDSFHWWSCRLCAWTWEDGDNELHEPRCFLGGFPNAQ